MIACFVLAGVVSGQRYPFRTYTTADGLAQNGVNSILQDHKGFLWFATQEGVSRFDGYEFAGLDLGIDTNIEVRDIVEDGDKRVWLATSSGVISFSNELVSTRDRDVRRFKIDEQVVGANSVRKLLIDSKGDLWCLTRNGLYRGRPSDDPGFTLVTQFTAADSRAFFEGDLGTIWFGVNNRLFEWNGNAAIDHGPIDGDTRDYIANGLRTKAGKIVILSQTKGLFEFDPAASTWTRMTTPTEFLNYVALMEDEEGAIWYGGRNVVSRFDSSGLTELSIEQGVTNDDHLCLFQDSEGNVWGGRSSLGVFKLPANPIISYPFKSERYSLGVSESAGVFTSYFCEPNDRRRIALWFCTPKALTLDSAGAQPYETKEILPIARYFRIYREGRKWGIAYNNIQASQLNRGILRGSDGREIDLTKFFEDSSSFRDEALFYKDGDVVWMARSDGSVLRIDAAGDALPSRFKWNRSELPTSMAIDNDGRLWLFSNHSFGYFTEGEFRVVPSTAPIPVNAVNTFMDSRGWLWVGTRDNGLFVCREPRAPSPQFDRYTVADGLGSLKVEVIIEDDFGKMYFGTVKGLNQVNVESGVWKTLTTKDGLTADSINGFQKDLSGNLWINSQYGLAKMRPVETSALNSPTYITEIALAGRRIPVSREFETVEMAAGENYVTVNYVGLRFTDEDSLKYQYLLDGAGAGWSVADKNRSVTFANLAAGEYGLSIRSIDEEGNAGPASAAIRFIVYPPIYLRWWFITLAVLTVVVVIFLLARLRTQRLVDIERTRTAIATDLHDDIGSNLSKISVLSDVVRLRAERGERPSADTLESIAEIARSSAASMSDIVWAIDPRRDSVTEMIRKMREYAEGLFSSKGIALTFSVDSGMNKANLSMEVRRNVYLIFKEGVNNIARHSNCTEAKVSIRAGHGMVTLAITDNGDGFSADAAHDGNGVKNIRTRVERCAGFIEIESGRGSGTRLSVTVPQR